MALCQLILCVDLYTVVCWCLYPQLLDYFAVDEDARIANLQQYAVNQVSTQCVCACVCVCVCVCVCACVCVRVVQFALLYVYSQIVHTTCDSTYVRVRMCIVYRFSCVVV